tara:strand:+ start:708 stop:941 length:234 start_codon:yes stop_codon:yes gene_type:complete
MDFIGGMGVGLVFSFIIGVGVISDSVGIIDISNIEVAVSKCPDQQYIDLVIFGTPAGVHEETKVTCLDGSVVIVKIK